MVGRSTGRLAAGRGAAGAVGPFRSLHNASDICTVGGHHTQRRSGGTCRRPKRNARPRPGRACSRRRPSSSPTRASTRCRSTRWPRPPAARPERSTPTSAASRVCSWPSSTRGRTRCAPCCWPRWPSPTPPRASWPRCGTTSPTTADTDSGRWALLEHELWLRAARDPEVAEVMRARDAEARRFSAHQLEGWTAAVGSRPSAGAGGAGRAGQGAAHRTGHAAPARHRSAVSDDLAVRGLGALVGLATDSPDPLDHAPTSAPSTDTDRRVTTEGAPS